MNPLIPLAALLAIAEGDFCTDVGGKSVSDSPSTTNYGLVVYLVSDSEPRSDGVRIVINKGTVARCLEDRRAQAIAGGRIRRGQAEAGRTAILLRIGGGKIPTQSVVYSQFARDLPGILKEQRPLRLAHAKVDGSASERWWW